MPRVVKEKRIEEQKSVVSHIIFSIIFTLRNKNIYKNTEYVKFIYFFITVVSQLA